MLMFVDVFYSKDGSGHSLIVVIRLIKILPTSSSSLLSSWLSWLSWLFLSPKPRQGRGAWGEREFPPSSGLVVVVVVVAVFKSFC